jgi:hypothetical protein
MTLTYTAIADIKLDMGPYVLNRRGAEVSQCSVQIRLSETLSHKDVND